MKLATEWRAIPGGLICVRSFPERVETIVARFRAGETLGEIGKSYDLSRERIRQIIAKYARCRGPVVGGVRVKTVVRVADLRAARDARYMKRLGMTFDEYRAHVDEYGSSARQGAPLERFRNQVGSAKTRGIEWQLLFADWWRIWQESGKWAERGRGHGYCMARFLDAGPYSADNIYICTGAENSRDSYVVDHPRRKRSERVIASWATA